MEGRSPYGERGLKCQGREEPRRQQRGRSPYGERGLKYDNARYSAERYIVALLTESVD